jgi:hypothetical protein
LTYCAPFFPSFCAGFLMLIFHLSLAFRFLHIAFSCAYFTGYPLFHVSWLIFLSSAMFVLLICNCFRIFYSMSSTPLVFPVY